MEELLIFAKDYINNASGQERTPARNAIIEKLALQYMSVKKSCNCENWYLDQLMLLLRMEQNDNQYRLRAGAVLSVAFASEDLTVTNLNLDDDKAEAHLMLDARKLDYFEQYPKDEQGEWIGVTKARFDELAEKFNLNDSHFGAHTIVLSDEEAEQPQASKRGRKPKSAVEITDEAIGE